VREQRVDCHVVRIRRSAAQFMPTLLPYKKEETAMKTDTELQRDVFDELRWDPRVNAAEIGVTAKDGIITLRGHVAHFAAKSAAVRTAQRVAGVKAVADDLEIRLPDIHVRTDADIAWAAVNVLTWNVFVPHDQITVTVHNGWITLEGTVEWHYQRAAAEHAVHSLLGVRGVTNVITVKPTVIPTAVKAQIEEAFRRSAAFDTRHITVEAEGRKVILSGHVHSWVEREEADAAAWATPGVYEVENRILVEP
jgi:osmotically-inducible protein OsmY